MPKIHTTSELYEIAKQDFGKDAMNLKEIWNIMKCRLINHFISEIYGDFVPKLYWENYEPMVFVYDGVQDMFVTDEGIGMKIDTPTTDINITNVNLLIYRFQEYVKVEYKKLFNIELGYEW